MSNAEKMRNRIQVYARIDKFGHKEPVIPLEPEMTYFNNKVQFHRPMEYDLFFAYTKPFPLFDGRKPKDNRGYLPDIRENIYQQECKKAVPALISQNYGKNPMYDIAEDHKNQNSMNDFYRRFGVMRVEEREVQ